MGETRVADIPGAHVNAPVVCPAAAAGTGISCVIFVAPFNCRIRKVTGIPAAAITGAATNNLVLTLYDRGKDGSGTTALASITFAAGTNWSADTENTLYAPTTKLSVDKGNVLEVVKTENGTGMALPVTSFVVEFEPR